MEIWVLDRGLRWSTGSKAKRSKLFRGEGLFQDSSRSVTEQLRDALVANSLRVMDIFREWDVNGDGLITKAEFHKVCCSCPLPHLSSTLSLSDARTFIFALTPALPFAQRSRSSGCQHCRSRSTRSSTSSTPMARHDHFPGAQSAAARDVKVEAKRGPEKPKEALAIADLDAFVETSGRASSALRTHRSRSRKTRCGARPRSKPRVDEIWTGNGHR